MIPIRSSLRVPPVAAVPPCPVRATSAGGLDLMSPVVRTANGQFDQPLRLTPILVPKPWGGRRLESIGRSLPPDVHVGESWEVADLEPGSSLAVDDAASRVSCGPLEGLGLSDLIRTNREAFLGTTQPVAGRFPLLIKFLDAREHLSVQVHPSEAYLRDDPTVSVKEETWIVLHAEPGSELMIGTQPGVSLRRFAAAVGSPAMVPYLRRVPAVVGEVHHVPAGTVHALGAGVMVAEVQTPSDTTFRMYDWEEEYGRPRRTLHPEQAVRAIAHEWGVQDRIVQPADATGVLVETSHYAIRRHHLPARAELALSPGRVRVLVLVDGEVALESDELAVIRGCVVVTPANWPGRVRSRCAANLLEILPTNA